MSCCCGSTTGDTIRVVDGYSLVRCRTCGLVRTDPQPDDLSSLYEGDYYTHWAAVTTVRPRMLGRANRAQRRVNLLRPLDERLAPGIPVGAPAKIVDVGCGDCQLITALHEVGWEVYGVDSDPHVLSVEHLPNVACGELEDQRYPDGSFDWVRYWHSLEHVRDPLRELREARRILRPGGRLLVGVPNYGGLFSRVAGARWFGLDVPRHLWHFTAESLEGVAAKAGFESIEVRQVSPSTLMWHTVDELRGRSDAEIGRARWLLGLPFCALLDVVRLGDCLVMVGSKPRL